MKKLSFLLAASLLFLSGLSSAQAPGSGPPCVTCASLKDLRWPDLRITEAVELKNDPKDKSRTDTTLRVPLCRVLGTIGREINFELLLPLSWNGRFVMGGGGGFVGEIQNMARNEVNNGYATSGTDTGHKGSGIDASWALNNAERQVNFGHLAVHRTAVVSKALIAHFYCAAPQRSYFVGCSRGGGQALMEAQRYPEDFDGIVAGAPAYDWTSIAAEGIRNTQKIYPDPKDKGKPVITKDNLRLLQAEIFRQCDALDGIRDSILNDPRKCQMDFSRLPLCQGDKAGPNCLTARQLEAIKTVYAGVTVDQTPVYPGFNFGGEDEKGGWDAWVAGPLDPAGTLPSLHNIFSTGIFKYLIYNDPDWDYSTYDFSSFIQDTRYAAANLNATSTDYSAFQNRGGKLILYHGWSDAALSALSTIEHYEAVEKADPNLRSYMRLFMLPGVLHCFGGPGPYVVNWLRLVEDWVEKGVAPDRVVLSGGPERAVKRTRPVFPYPKVAVYDGKGNPNAESSFREK